MKNILLLTICFICLLISYINENATFQDKANKEKEFISKFLDNQDTLFDDESVFSKDNLNASKCIGSNSSVCILAPSEGKSSDQNKKLTSNCIEQVLLMYDE